MSEGEEEIDVYTDGASRGNPGHACSAFILIKDRVTLEEGVQYLGEVTNNTAEYQAIIHGLDAAARRGGRRLAVHSDSELVIRQINGQYSIRQKHLSELCKEVEMLTRRFDSVRFCSVPRTHPLIQRADFLCNQCLDAEVGLRGSRRYTG
ncbi:MAG TPA: ribonuclease HI family protein [Methanomicrobiales archaeon]|nr:ribonuclease HI family protein [Methanomicrobiales archaeon]